MPRSRPPAGRKPLGTAHVGGKTRRGIVVIWQLRYSEREINALTVFISETDTNALYCVLWRLAESVGFGGEMVSSKLQDRLAYPPRGLRAERAAAYVGMAESTFYKLVAQGVFPAPIKIGGMRLWDRLKLDAAFDNLKTEEEEQSETEERWRKILEYTRVLTHIGKF